MGFERFIKEAHEMVNAHRRALGLPDWDFGDGITGKGLEHLVCKCGCANVLSTPAIQRGVRYCHGHKKLKALAAGAD